MILNSLFKYRRHIFFFVLLLWFVHDGHLAAQQTRIIGTVTDFSTKEPLPFVNLIIKGTTVGATTGFDGKFTIETKGPADSLLATFLGYNRQSKKILKGKFQTVDFELLSTSLQLAEVVIVPGENPAEKIMKEVVKNKVNNDRERYSAYQYEAYSKIQFDANNITEAFKNKKIFKPFQFIFENLDTSTVNGKAYLPIFLTESISDVYFRKEPKSQKEIIKASKVSGIKNESFSQFLGDLIQNINIYDNYLMIFQKNFVSPTAGFGLVYYKYYLVDSTYIDGKYCYKIMFKPRHKQELTFTGHFWVHDSTWAIKEVEMKMVDDANINFIKDMVIKQAFERINEKSWMMVKDQLIIDFNVIENSRSTMGFYGRKTTSYRNFIFDTPKPNEFYSTPTNIIVEDNSLERNDNYWKNARHDSLSRDEKTIYHMIDTLKSLPAFRTYVDVIKMVTTGYYENKQFEWGPYMSTLSFNPLEGTRLRLGGRTSNEFSKKIELSGHLAYGVQDQTWKYGIASLYMFNKNPRRALHLSHKWDIEQLGQSQNAFREDFLLASLFRRNPADKLSMVREYHGMYEHEWFNGFISRVHFTNRSIYALGDTMFKVISSEPNQLLDKRSITTSEIRVDARLAFKERFVMGEFERRSLGAKYPILEIQYSYGIPNLLKGEYEFHRLQLGVEHWFNIGSLGWSKYIIEAGRIWGKVPYPLLKLHEGNETFSFDEYSFNTMNFYEFVSDRYLSAYYTHHFGGLFFNRVPLLRKLKWREVGFIKGLVGTFDTKNIDIRTLPKGMGPLDKPYFEGGVGIENIFRVLRTDFIWRLSYLDHQNITKYGIRFTLWFDF
jgi:hypothetical protein